MKRYEIISLDTSSITCNAQETTYDMCKEYGDSFNHHDEIIEILKTLVYMLNLDSIDTIDSYILIIDNDTKTVVAY